MREPQRAAFATNHILSLLLLLVSLVIPMQGLQAATASQPTNLETQLLLQQHRVQQLEQLLEQQHQTSQRASTLSHDQELKLQQLQLKLGQLQQEQQQSKQQFQQNLNIKTDSLSERVGDISLYLAIYGGLITLILAAFASITYLNAASQAKRSAVSATEDWIKEHASNKIECEITSYIDGTATKRLKATANAIEVKFDQQLNQKLESLQKQLDSQHGKLNSLHDLVDQLSLERPLTEYEQHQSQDAARKPENKRTFDDWNLLAIAAYQRNDYLRALETFEQAIKTAETDEQLEHSLFNKGVTLGKLGQPIEEIACYEQLLQRYRDSDQPALQDRCASALLNMGATLSQQDQPDNAIACYEELLQRYGDSNQPALQEYCAKALWNKGATLGQQGQPDKKISCFEKLLQRYVDNDQPPLQEQCAMVLLNMGVTLGQLKKSDEEIACYEQLLQRYSNSNQLTLQEQCAMALLNKAATLIQQGQLDKAIACYEQLLQQYGDSDQLTLQEYCAKALWNKGAALGQQGQSDEEIACYEQLLQRYDSSDQATLQALCASALLRKGVMLDQQEEPDEKIACYEQLLQHYHDSNEPALQELYSKTLNDKGFLLLYQAKRTEWQEGAGLANQDFLSSRQLLQESLENISIDDLWVVKGNLSYAHYLCGDTDEETWQQLLAEAIDLGGARSYQGLKEDIKTHHLPRDDIFEDYLEKLYASYQARQAQAIDNVEGD
ncbi:hypothetical protein DV711_16935 [Motiliproteus coralliicola]|uniref:Uncharacterized protein n=1 Tax=Motiliproteus coralliicola TaxID=2283196 RepID=A0A369W8W4_9GAMM|nr:tetratricopeptide repeat protein [Motiliproteus coralliicola]RDE18342.1 hypothetical protein DV711_16935 [Motiliproteus coralliicola]